MSTVDDKPIGYFEKVLAIDCESTGLVFNSDDPSVGHQSVSWGFVVADGKTLKPIEELYVEIKWNEETKLARKKDSTFGKKAETVHGLTYEYLEENGLTEEEAVAQIATLILKYWGPENKICLLGHNVVTFDLWFLKRLFRTFEIELRFGNRHVDTNSVGYVNWETYTSDELFETVGLPVRGEHNALDDAKYSLESARRTRLIFNKALNDG
jgi:hypothetical protein